MKTNVISSNNFDGKVKLHPKLTKPMLEYANQILDYPFSGTTARERIKKATYDVNIFGWTTKKTIHPKLHFYSSFNLLKDKKQEYHVGESRFVSGGKGTSIHSSVAEGAHNLNYFLSRFEQRKRENSLAYNTFGEKMIAIFNRFLGIKK